MLLVQVRVVPGMPNSIWMLSSEENSTEQCQINMIEVLINTKLTLMYRNPLKLQI